ncbi:SPOR domain-containing protein [Chryseobacterium sp.]|uniref:SPOR domain-containing protein n=1 Tax=Chryseobacterium sp. TaxID=1871047 RepID=UPI00289CFCE9|nr:SPOR domain-containing protein [Chryseobacterium sp.]
MKKIIAIFSVFALCGINHIEAQQVVKKDTISGTELTITMDSRVNDALSNLEEHCEKNTYGKSFNYSDDEVKKPTKILVPSRELTNAEVCRKNPRILGYKLLVATVKSNEEANEIKTYFRKRFPNLKVETDASLRPNYKILAGSYFTKQSASGDLSRVKEYFKSAVSVQYRIFCAEAK